MQNSRSGVGSKERRLLSKNQHLKKGEKTGSSSSMECFFFIGFGWKAVYNSAFP